MERELEPIKVKVCDECGEEEIDYKCYFCGKDLCASCTAFVHFIDSEIVRNKEILFVYDKPMCKKHLPPKRDCE